MTTQVGPMVATLARAKGVTLAEVADVLGIHRNRLTDKINGRQHFRESDILALADYFGIEPGRLFGDPLALLTGVSESACTEIMLVSDHELALAA